MFNVKVAFHTICSDDHFQHFIPMYCYTIKVAYPEMPVFIGLVGKADEITRRACAMVGCTIRDIDEPYQPVSGYVITEFNPQVPLLESTINTMRWLYFPKVFSEMAMAVPGSADDVYDAVLATDIDFLMFRHDDIHIVDWHVNRMKMHDMCFFAHHGPWKHPARFPGGWSGERERLAGGYVFLTREWMKKTMDARLAYSELLQRGAIGRYREEDEVVLCKICRKSGLKYTQNKYFNEDLRGIHLGDFKESMTHRHTNMAKMITKLSHANCQKFMEMDQTDETWQKVKQICCEDPKIARIFDNLYIHLRKRGFVYGE